MALALSDYLDALTHKLTHLKAGLATVHAEDVVVGASSTPLADSIWQTGDYKHTTKSVAPSGWLLCDGSAVSRITYANLFAELGTTYGAGDGSTTFGLPNLKGRALVARDAAQTEFDVLGETGGAKTHALTLGETGAHDHTLAGHFHSGPSHDHSFASQGLTTNSDAHTHAVDGRVGTNNSSHVHNSSSGQYSTEPTTSQFFQTPNSTALSDAHEHTIGSHGHGFASDGAGATSGPNTGNTSSTGSGTAHNNLQPYFICNIMIKT